MTKVLTALTVAATHGQLEAVKYLVRRGAKLFHESSCSQESVFPVMAAHGKKEVLR